jgi:hypothetical protein
VLQPEEHAVIFERAQQMAQYADVDLFIAPLPAAPEEDAPNEEEDAADEEDASATDSEPLYRDD